MMALLNLTALTNALPAPWLPIGTPVEVERVIARARRDVVAVVEIPPGSNRSTVIDEYNARAHVPPGSYWCASAVAAWWEDAGLPVPAGRASCDAWAGWAKATGRWSDHPALGAAILYGVPGDASHIGLVARVLPVMLVIEGNTTIDPGYSRNGIAVMVKQVDPKSPRILGYVLPFSTLDQPAANAA